MGTGEFGLYRSFRGIYTYLFSVFSLGFKRNDTVSFRKKSVVATHTYVVAWKELGSTLPNQDASGSDLLTAEPFYPQSSARAVPAVS